MFNKKYSPAVIGNEVHFKLFAPKAEAVELCIFDANFNLKNNFTMTQDGDLWHVSLPLISYTYAYRLSGRWEPRAGYWFNKNKFLFDPFAKAVARAPCWAEQIFSHKNSDLEISQESNINCAALSAFLVDDFDWSGDISPNIPWSKTVIYETHLKGLTKSHPEIENNLQGTYLGLSTEPVIKHLKNLGVTAIELLPLQAFFTERSLYKNKLENYWGYNPYAWLAPDPRYASQQKIGAEVFELKQTIKNLHKAGIEVILDVVFNHSAEGEFLGPVLSMRGIDNSYYLFDGDYINYTGCGNTLDFSKPIVRALAHEALETWVTDYHIDGFRFDLAASLQRNGSSIEDLNSFFAELVKSPLMQNKKIIAEPWDINAYQLGAFPRVVAEWNDTYRDTVRKYWSGWSGVIGDFATKISGSSDKFQNKGPLSSINFVTAHDGFCLRDLVSYSTKRNQANAENNRDGAEQNFSVNCGYEGESRDANIVALRQQKIRNYFFTLVFSAGVPMICAGDEIGKTQDGNNNAYCHDSELTWLNWKVDWDFREYLSALIEIRKNLSVFNRDSFYAGDDLIWLTEYAQQMDVEQWQSDNRKIIGAVYRANSQNIVVLYNSSEQEVNFKLERDAFLNVDTSIKPYIFNTKVCNDFYILAPNSAVLLVSK